MFSFLAPLALLGASLLAIPVLIHIFKPEKVKPTPFSSLRWLRLTKQRLSRTIRWHQILLFILRALFVLFLVFALAKPVFFLAEKKDVTERFIVLDVSRSMSYKIPDRPTPLEQGRIIAEQLLLEGTMGDRSTLLLTGNTTETTGPLVEDTGPYIARLKSVIPTLQ